MHIIMSSAKYVTFKFTIAPPSSNIGDIVMTGAGIVNPWANVRRGFYISATILTTPEQSTRPSYMLTSTGRRKSFVLRLYSAVL